MRRALSFFPRRTRVFHLLLYSTCFPFVHELAIPLRTAQGFHFAHVQHEYVGTAVSRMSRVVECTRHAGYETLEAGQVNACTACSVYSPLFVTYTCRFQQKQVESLTLHAHACYRCARGVLYTWYGSRSTLFAF